MHTAWLLSHVLSLSPGRLALFAYRLPAPPWSCGGHRVRGPARDSRRGPRPMTGISATAARQRSSAITAALVIVLPIALTLICLAARLDIITLSQTIRATLLFVLLLALMATG